MRLFLAVLVSFMAASSVETADEFYVCPPIYPNSFNNGSQCCAAVQDCHTKTIQRSSSTCCLEDQYTNCPYGICEDYQSPCIDWNFAITDMDYSEVIVAQGFEDATYNGQYRINLQDLNQTIFVNNRPVFDKGNYDQCIWWRHKERYWLMGSCTIVGEFNGYAYLKDDLNCPYGDLPANTIGKWQKRTDATISAGFTLRLPQMRGSGGYTPTENSATTGIGSTISNGKWKKKCTLKFRRGKWRCVKRRKKPNSAEAKN